MSEIRGDINQLLICKPSIMFRSNYDFCQLFISNEIIPNSFLGVDYLNSRRYRLVNMYSVFS